MDINNEINDVLATYTQLIYEKSENALIGDLLIDKHDSYEVKIVLDSYPSHIPTVYETEGRIPNKTDRHIYSDTGSCCITTRAKGQILLKTKVNSLKKVIEMLIIPYFQNNSYYEINREYFADEYSHNFMGVIEGYQDILGTNNNFAICRLIYDRLNKGKLKIKDQCYCGSNLLLKKCNRGKHDQCYRQFKLIDKQTLVTDLEYFESYFNIILESDPKTY